MVKSRILFLIGFVFLLCYPFILIAQEPFFKVLPVAGTSPGFKINAICQDSSMFMWIATSEGLWKHDGVSFNKIKLPPVLSDRNISAVHPLQNGGILAGTAKGKIFTVIDGIAVEKDLPSVTIDVAISSFQMKEAKEFWFSTLGEGIFKVRGEAVTNYTTNDGLGDDYVYSMLFDENGILWTGSDGGLSYAYKKENGIGFHNLTTKDGLPENIIRNIKNGPGNTIGIGMEEKGFCLYDTKKKQFLFKEQFSSWTSGPATALVLLENEFWIGTQKSGIFDFEFQAERRIRQFNKSNGFNGSNVTCLLRDHEGNIWIGAGNELYFSLGEKIEFKRSVDGENLVNIRTLLVDRYENIWYSTDHGVYRFKKHFLTGSKINLPGISNTGEKLSIISMYEDNYGFIWMGTFDHGVCRYDPLNNQWRIFSDKDGLINSNVLSIDGHDNEIWFATLGGVSKCILNDSLFGSDISFVSFSEQHGLGNNFIYNVLVDSRNRVWFATDGNGITLYENGKFINYSEKEGLKSKVVYSLTEDKKGDLWLSTSGEGIFRFDGKSFKNISLEQGLSDLNVTALIADEMGNIVVVNKKGIDVINPDTYHILSFGNEMGITNIDPDVNVAENDLKGNVWIGASNGIIKMNLGQQMGGHNPVLRLNNVLCFLQKVDTSVTKEFPYNRNHISFDYITFWYADPQKVSYQYKLEGYNKEWITTRDRFITFPNLRPGNYKFMLRTSVNNNFTNSEIVPYNFVIRSPFWERAWFIAGMAGIIGLIFYSFIRRRDKRLKSAERLKKEKIESQFEILKNQVNPHFLFNSFNTLITVIEDNREVAIDYVNKLSDFFRSILSYRERDIITIGEELKLVETYIFLQQKRYGNNFIVEIDLPATVREKNFLPPLALQILIENCLKHNSISRETQLKVEIFMDKKNYLVVRNNINPKFMKDPSTGIGLQNLINRYQLLSNQEISISEYNGYFTVKLPQIKM